MDSAEGLPRPLRLGLFGINYAPEPTGIGPYTAGLAEHFASNGISVQVVTGLPHYPQWRGLTVPLPRNPPNLLLRRYRHSVPRQPGLAGRLLYETTWLASASRALFRLRCDVAIGVIPSLSGGVLAWLCGARFQIPVGLIFQDLLGPAAAQSGYPSGTRVSRLTGAVETFLARRATRVAIVTEGFRPYLEGAGVAPSAIDRVRNWVTFTDPAETAAQTRARLGWAPLEFVCLHAGNIGQKQGLDTLLETAAILRDQSVRIVIAGDGNDRQRLIDRAQELRLDNVCFLPIQKAGEFEAMLVAADVLLLNQRASVVDMALPSKLTAYFSSGRPVVAAVSSRSDSAREIEVSGAGIVVPPGDPPAIVGALMTLRESPDLRVSLGQKGRAYAGRYLTSEASLGGYDDFLSHLVGAGPRIHRPD